MMLRWEVRRRRRCPEGKWLPIERWARISHKQSHLSLIQYIFLKEWIVYWTNSSRFGNNRKNCEKMNNKPHNNKGEEEKKKASKCLLFMPSRRQVRAEWVSEGIVDKIIKANNIKKFPRSGIFIGNVHRQRIAVWDTHRMHRIVTCRRCRFD